MNFTFKPIGLVHSPFKTKEDVPGGRNTDDKGFESVEGTLEIFPEYEEGLEDIEGYSHLIVIFVFHQSGPGTLKSHPPHDGKERGVFATRSFHRPNPLGLTIVCLLGREGRFLKVRGVDMVEGTPILDIKPYTPRDCKKDARFGWLEKFL